MTTTFTLDPVGRRASATTAGGSGAGQSVVRHYTDTSDNPGYVTSTFGGVSTSTWYGASINGDLGVTVTGGTVTVSLIDPQGSTATTITVNPDDPVVSVGQVGAWDEYGNTLAALSVVGPVHYGWLGGKERATDASGLVLMGARLYNPVTGLFTSVDPVPGGNTTDYTYPQDPINKQDLNGMFKLRKWIKRAVKFAGIGAAVGCMVLSAGICGVVALGATALSIGSNYYGWKKREMTGKQFAVSAVLDVASLAFPAVRSSRAVGKHTGNTLIQGGFKLRGNFAMRYGGRHTDGVRPLSSFRSVQRSIAHNARAHPLKTRAALALQMASAVRSAR